MVTRCLLGAILGIAVGFLAWQSLSPGLLIVGVVVAWAEDFFDPFCRYRRAYYTAILVDDDGRRTWSRCEVLIVDETSNYYRLRFPLWWRMTTSYPGWVEKGNPSLTVID